MQLYMRKRSTAIVQTTLFCSVLSYLNTLYPFERHPALFSGHPSNIMAVDGGLSALSPSELLRCSIDTEDDGTGAYSFSLE